MPENELEDFLTLQKTFRDAEEARKVTEVIFLVNPIIQRQTARAILVRIRQLLKQYGHLPPTSLDNLEAEFTEAKKV